MDARKKGSPGLPLPKEGKDTVQKDAGSLRGESGKGRRGPQGGPGSRVYQVRNSWATSKDSFSRESGLVSFVSLLVGRLGIRLQLCGV